MNYLTMCDLKMFYIKMCYLKMRAFKDVLCTEELFEDIWFKDVLYKDVWFKDVLYYDVDMLWINMCCISCCRPYLRCKSRSKLLWFKKLSILMELYKMFTLLSKLHLELCCCIVSDGGLMPDRSFMTLAMGA
jgi:hypothetical protein